MAPDNRLERPEDGSLSPAAGDATAPAAQTPELGPEPPPPSDATRRDPGRRGRERSREISPLEAATKECKRLGSACWHWEWEEKRNFLLYRCYGPDIWCSTSENGKQMKRFVNIQKRS